MPRYSEAELRAFVPNASSLTEVLRHFGLRPAGGNHRLLRHWLDEWGISTAHFIGTPHGPPRRDPIPLEKVLVADSRYSRTQLKERLYESGLKIRACEQCGQGEDWRGRRMSLILDHVNGVADDNRLENPQIVCPNCAATLDTHCGRANRRPREARACALCGDSFTPKFREQRYCSRRCGVRSHREGRRRVVRPSYEQLVAEVATTSWSAVGRTYGVSDNAVRKWVRAYERERSCADSEGLDG